MLRALCLSAALVVVAVAPLPVVAEVTVTYVAPERFRDREFGQERSRASALAEFDKAFERLATRHLPAGQRKGSETPVSMACSGNLVLQKGFDMAKRRKGHIRAYTRSGSVIAPQGDPGQVFAQRIHGKRAVFS